MLPMTNSSSAITINIRPNNIRLSNCLAASPRYADQIAFAPVPEFWMDKEAGEAEAEVEEEALGIMTGPQVCSSNCHLISTHFLRSFLDPYQENFSVEPPNHYEVRPVESPFNIPKLPLPEFPQLSSKNEGGGTSSPNGGCQCSSATFCDCPE
jgi:hypothetical protein